MNDRWRFLPLAAVALYTAGVFVGDVLTPQGYEVWVLYLPVLLVPVWFNTRRYILITGAVCTLLMMVGFALSPLGMPTSRAWENLVMGLLALWLMAFAGITIARRSLQLADAMQSLQREIAQHQRTERALAQSEERLRLAVEGAGMGTWDLALKTGKAVWSDTHFRMIGTEPTPGGETRVGAWLAHIHPGDRDRVLAAKEQARSRRSLYSAEYRVNRADTGEIVWVAVFGRFLYDEAGEAVRFVGVSFDVTERKRAEESLRESQERLRRLEHELLDIAAREQRRIGQELHDGVGQELTGLALMAQALAQHLHGSQAEERIALRLVAGLNEVHQQVRTLSRGLVPVEVEAKGLCAALEDLAASSGEQSGVPVTFDCPEWMAVQDHATATQLFRIAQEAVANALRHSQAQHVYLRLLAGPQALRLVIEDDGTGIRGHPEEGDGMGLRIMQYRAEQVGGVLEIGPGEGGGTVVTCLVPGRLDHDKEDARNGFVYSENPDSR